MYLISSLIVSLAIILSPYKLNDSVRLKGIHPVLAQKVNAIIIELEQKGWNPVIGSGLRTLKEQKKLLKKGYTTTLRSKHLTGRAVDIVDKRYGWSGKASNLNFQFWKDLGEAAKRQGLIWGGNWKTFKDVAHVQLPNRIK